MSRRFTSIFVASALTALTLLSVPTMSFASPRHAPAWRMRHQQGRIYQGVRQGQIGPGEYRHLEREEFRTARLRSRFLHNDGHIGPRERRILEHRLNHTSRDIYRDRHD